MLVNYPLYGGETIDKANVLERGQILRLLDPLTLDLDLRFTNMEVYGVDKKLSELGDSELNELLDADMFNPIIDCSRSEHFPNEWFGNWFEDSVLNDKLMSDMEQSPHVQVEHSYSLALSESGPNSPLDENFKIDVYKDLESECFPSIPMDTIHLPQYVPLTIKKEVSSLKTPCMVKSQMPQPMIVVSNPANSRQQRLVLPKVNIKVEPTDVCDQNITFGLPPTPPSSSNSDSEGCQSPTHSIPSSPPSCSPVKQSSRSFSHHGVRSTGTPPAISNQNTQSTGVLVLTEEEKRTLLAEGYPIPSKLPLTKAEEKSLKKIRRKIKNKISAQESRRKKKEYLDALEKRVESFSSENTDLKKKMENLESNNKSLLAQLQKLQAIAGKITKSYRTTSTQTCLMVLVLCFAIVLGPWSPSFLNTDKHSIINSYTTSLDNSIKLSLSQLDQPPRLDPYTTPNKRSRMLLAFTEDGEDLMPYGPPRNQHSPAIQKKNQMVSNPKPSNLLPCHPLTESNMVTLSTGVESSTLLVDNLMVQQITSNIVTTEPRINATE